MHSHGQKYATFEYARIMRCVSGKTYSACVMRMVPDRNNRNMAETRTHYARQAKEKVCEGMYAYEKYTGRKVDL